MQPKNIFIPEGLSHLNPFAYLLYHKKSSRFYCGYKESQKDKLCNSQTFMTEGGYPTSSKYIKEIIDDEGFDAFEIVFICHFETGAKAHKFETEFLKYYDADINPAFINKHIGDKKWVNPGKSPSKETRDKMSAAQKARYQKMSTEEKEKRNRKLRDAQLKFLQTMSNEDKEKYMQNLSNTQIKSHQNKSTEQKAAFSQKISDVHRNRSLEEKIKFSKTISDAHHNKSDEEKALESQRRSVVQQGKKLYDKVGEKSKYFKEQPSDPSWVLRNKK